MIIKNMFVMLNILIKNANKIKEALFKKVQLLLLNNIYIIL